MKVLLPILVISLFLILAGVAHAQESLGISGISHNIEVAESVSPGDILVATDAGIRRATKAYDSGIIGVVVESPAISVGVKTDNTAAILASGRANVRVSTAEGAIAPGDFITSSVEAGVGQRAQGAGYVLGRALSGYDNTSETGLIPVLVAIGVNSPAGSLANLPAALLKLLGAGLVNADNFPLVLRYISAAAIGVATFVLASFSFVRFMRTGLEALGRNPLARGTIIGGMIFNAAIVMMLTLSGFGIALAIVAL